MSTNRDLTWRLGVTDNASGAFSKVGDASESMSSKVGGAISKIGGQIGGELGEILSKGGEAFTKFGESGGNMGIKLAAAGAGIAGIGIALQTIGSGDKAAEQQLDAAATAAGQSIADFGKQIDAAKSKAEDFGHSGADAQLALAKLTESTGDVSVALAQMTLVENLAAAKHESLVDAATQISAIFAGNTKILKQYGIVMKVTAGNTQEATAATTALGDKLAGQAAAQANTFTGALDAAKLHAIDFAARIGNDIGPAVTFFGSALGIVGVGIDLYSSRQEHATASALEFQAAEEKMAPLLAEQAAATAAAAEEMDVLGVVTEEASARVVAADAAITAANEETAASSSLMDLATGPVGIALGAVTVAAGLAFGAMKLFSGSSAAAAKPIDALTTALKNNQGAFDNDTRAAITNSAQKAGLFTITDKLGISAASLTNGLNGNTQAYHVNVAALQATVAAGQAFENGQNLHRQSLTAGEVALGDNAKAAAAALAIYQSLGGQVDASTAAAGQFAAANDVATISTTSAAGALSAEAQSASQGTLDINALSQSIIDLSNGQLGLAGDADAVQKSFNNLTAGIKTNKAAITGNTDGAIANRDAIRSSITAIENYASSQLKSGDSVADVTKTLQGNMAQLEQTAIKAGISKSAFETMIAQMKLTPGNIITNITADTSQATKAIIGIAAQLHALGNGVTVPIYVNSQGNNVKGVGFNASGGVISHEASGGGNSLTWVGEYGPELIDGNMRVYPHGQSEQMARSIKSSPAAPIVINLNVSKTVGAFTVQDGQQIAAALQPWLNAGGKL